MQIAAKVFLCVCVRFFCFFIVLWMLWVSDGSLCLEQSALVHSALWGPEGATSQRVLESFWVFENSCTTKLIARKGGGICLSRSFFTCTCVLMQICSPGHHPKAHKAGFFSSAIFSIPNDAWWWWWWVLNSDFKNPSIVWSASGDRNRPKTNAQCVKPCF